MPILITLPECAMETLQAIYPTVDWSRVDFYEGLPWWVIQGEPVNTSALVLPRTVSFGGFNLYLGKNTNFCDADHMATLVHEAFHVYQYTSIWGGFGLGLMRPGFIKYWQGYMNGGDDNAIEADAYEIDEAFKECYGDNGPCNCDAGGDPVFDLAALEGILACNPDLVQDELYEFQKDHWLTSLINWILGFLITAIIFILLMTIGAVVAIFICQNYDNWERKCREYREEVSEDCREWRDQGSNQCNDWATQRWQECCDWQPCRFFCRAMVWLSRVICVGYHWVANLVCQTWVLVRSTICIVFIWVMKTVTLCWWR